MAPASSYLEIRCTPVRSALAALATLPLNEKVGYIEALGTKSMKVYLGDKLHIADPRDKTQPFHEFLRKHQVGVVHVTAYLRDARAFAHDPEWIAFLEEPAKFGFTTLPLPCGEWLYVRESSLQASK
jgi:hypothetical protein